MSFLFADGVGSSPNFVGSQFSEALKELSEPWQSGERVKAAISRAARLTDLSYWRAFDIWYRKARRIDAHEAHKITQALRLKREKAARDEYQELRTRLIRLESRLVAGQTDIDRATLNADQSSIGGLGPMGRTVGGGRR